MALQGDLRSFALPDVLRLLAGTAKSGRLEVQAPTSGGEVWLRDGGVAGGRITSAPHAERPADVVFELLRLVEGSFVFDEDEDLPEVQDAELTSVDETLAEAESLVAEWEEVETVVPSMYAWVSFAPTIESDEVTIDADSWRTLAAIGNGGTVSDLAGVLELTDLAASRQVKALVESGLALVRAEPAYEPPVHMVPEVEIDYVVPVDEEPFDPTALHREAYDDLEAPAAEERPVVMESSEDALLPEPLPGEGVSYAADSVTAGNVDGRIFETPGTIDHEAPYAHEVEPVAAETYAPFVAEAFHAEDTEADGAEPEMIEADEMDDADEAGFMFGEVPRHDFHGKNRGITSLEEELAAGDPELAPMPVDEGDDAAAELAAEREQAEGDRGSLLKFLSTVQP